MTSKEITHIGLGVNETDEKYISISVHRVGGQEQVRSYMPQTPSINRTTLMIKSYMGLLSFEEKLFLQSLFPVRHIAEPEEYPNWMINERDEHERRSQI